MPILAISVLSSPLQRASKARAQIMPILAISVLSGPLQRASQGPGPDYANFGYFYIERSFTKSLEGPGPRFGQFWLFLYEAVLYKEPRRLPRARAHIWPILVISVLSGPLQRASQGPGPDFANFGYFCIKQSFTKSLEGPGPKLCQFWLFLYEAALYKEPRRARAQIMPILVVSVLSGPLQGASKGPGPDLANFGCLAISV